MSYVRDSLMAGERVVHEAPLHWIILVRSVFYMAVTGCASGIGYARGNTELLGAAALLFLISFLIFMRSLVLRACTEFAVTDRRVVAKWGVVSRTTYETSLRRIEGVHVVQSVLGRLLGYGTVVVHGVGGDASPIVLVTDPLLFRAAIDRAADAAEARASGGK
jgi:uncharacterized membrane protein YdbT with pleckstrin-like domain